MESKVSLDPRASRQLGVWGMRPKVYKKFRTVETDSKNHLNSVPCTLSGENSHLLVKNFMDHKVYYIHS
jgi:hypothetical protein